MNWKNFEMYRYLILLLLFDLVYGCGVCYGDPNAAAVDGMNKAIIFLLGTTSFVLSGVVLSIISIGKKSKTNRRV
tara:strand:- start:1275 stop:1499 length:225 start_codon:yes stop_codon:yes gene_type:complete